MINLDGSGEEFPDFDFERTLTSQEVLGLRDDVIWPAVSRGARYDFLSSANIGDTFKLERYFPSESGIDGMLRCLVWASCYMHEISEDESKKLHCVVVSIEEKKPEQTIPLAYSIAEAYAKKGGVTHFVPDDIAEYMSAWLRREYYFDTDDNDPLRVDLELRLIDEDGEDELDPNLDRHLFNNDSDSNLGDAERDILGDIEKELKPTITKEDELRIKTTLGMLGLMGLG